jgi:hypothetical protein
MKVPISMCQRRIVFRCGGRFTTMENRRCGIGVSGGLGGGVELIWTGRELLLVPDGLRTQARPGV